MKKQNIIEGYKGIMPLDLTLVDKKIHKSLIDQHLKDIEDYKIEQSKLKPEMRFENTIEKIKNLQDKEKEIIKERLRVKKLEQDKIDKDRERIFYHLVEKK